MISKCTGNASEISPEVWRESVWWYLEEYQTSWSLRKGLGRVRFENSIGGLKGFCKCGKLKEGNQRFLSWNSNQTARYNFHLLHFNQCFLFSFFLKSNPTYPDQIMHHHARSFVLLLLKLIHLLLLFFVHLIFSLLRKRNIYCRKKTKSWIINYFRWFLTLRKIARNWCN